MWYRPAADYLYRSSLLTFKLISAYLLSKQLPAFWSLRSLDNASKLKSFVNPIAWLLESHWELFNINGEGLPDSQSHFLFIIQACLSTSCFPHTDKHPTTKRSHTTQLPQKTSRSGICPCLRHGVLTYGFKSRLGPLCKGPQRYYKFTSCHHIFLIS